MVVVLADSPDDAANIVDVPSCNGLIENMPWFVSWLIATVFGISTWSLSLERGTVIPPKEGGVFTTTSPLYVSPMSIFDGTQTEIWSWLSFPVSCACVVPKKDNAVINADNTTMQGFKHLQNEKRI